MRKLTPNEAAERLGVSPKTLAIWRWKGVGPRYQKPSPARVRYTEEDLARYEAETTFGSAAEEKRARAQREAR